MLYCRKGHEKNQNAQHDIMIFNVRELRPGMTFRDPKTNQRWQLLRCPQTGEFVAGLSEPLMNSRRNKWIAAPVANLSNEMLMCFDELMDARELDWNSRTPCTNPTA